MLKNKKKKGFTLIELIVVIAIIGILAAIAVPRLSSFKGDAEKKACQGTQRTIESAAAIYNAEKGSFPAAVGDLVTAKYLADTPKCPTSGTYAISADGVVTCTDAAHKR